MGMINVEVIPKGLQKPLLYGALLGVGLLAFSIYRKGVAGTTADIAGGVVKGVAGAVGGVVTGIVTATGDVIVDGYNTLPNAVKPTSADNIAYSTTNKIGTALTGDKNFTFGGWIYDITH